MARANAAVISSSFDPKWCINRLMLTPRSAAIGRNVVCARPCSARYDNDAIEQLTFELRIRGARHVGSP